VSSASCAGVVEGDVSWFSRLSRVAHGLPYLVFLLITFMAYYLGPHVPYHAAMTPFVSRLSAGMLLALLLMLLLKVL
jgi:hypothetical protein